LWVFNQGKTLKKLKDILVFKVFTFLLAATLALSPDDVRAAALAYMPEAGQLIGITQDYDAPRPIGIKIDPQNPLKLSFILDQGNFPLDKEVLAAQAKIIGEYFLAALTLPEKELWVNLSPYERNRISTLNLAQTNMGKDMLGEDYVLKQLAASLTYPESESGKKYWSAIQGGSGSPAIPVNVFNKVWIVPGKIVVYENPQRAIIGEAALKVMAEEDYFAAVKTRKLQINHMETAEMAAFKANVLPLIDQEVNHGKHFARLRQIYSSIILANWFKNKLKSSILNDVYFNQRKTRGINTDDPEIRKKIYESYLEAFKKGAYNCIKCEHSVAGSITRRAYFSGGENLASTLEMTDIRPDSHAGRKTLDTLESRPVVTLDLVAVNGSNALGVRSFRLGQTDGPVVLAPAELTQYEEMAQHEIMVFATLGRFSRLSTEGKKKIAHIMVLIAARHSNPYDDSRMRKVVKLCDGHLDLLYATSRIGNSMRHPYKNLPRTLVPQLRSTLEPWLDMHLRYLQSRSEQGKKSFHDIGTLRAAILRAVEQNESNPYLTVTDPGHLYYNPGLGYPVLHLIDAMLARKLAYYYTDKQSEAQARLVQRMGNIEIYTADDVGGQQEEILHGVAAILLHHEFTGVSLATTLLNGFYGIGLKAAGYYCAHMHACLYMRDPAFWQRYREEDLEANPVKRVGPTTEAAMQNGLEVAYSSAFFDRTNRDGLSAGVSCRRGLAMNVLHRLTKDITIDAIRGLVDDLLSEGMTRDDANSLIGTIYPYAMAIRRFTRMRIAGTLSVPVPRYIPGSSARGQGALSARTNGGVDLYEVPANSQIFIQGKGVQMNVLQLAKQLKGLTGLTPVVVDVVLPHSGKIR